MEKKKTTYSGLDNNFFFFSFSKSFVQSFFSWLFFFAILIISKIVYLARLLRGFLLIILLQNGIFAFSPRTTVFNDNNKSKRSFFFCHQIMAACWWTKLMKRINIKRSNLLLVLMQCRKAFVKNVNEEEIAEVTNNKYLEKTKKKKHRILSINLVANICLC